MKTYNQFATEIFKGRSGTASKPKDETKAALEAGLNKKVKSWLTAIKSGKIAQAKATKKEILAIVKEKKLNKHDVLFVFGDPDNPIERLMNKI